MAIELRPATVESEARYLAEENFREESQILRTYWFPASDEVRLIRVDPATPPSESVRPFYFGASPVNRLYFSSAIALIRPEEERLIPLPEGWTWDDAVLLLDRAS